MKAIIALTIAALIQTAKADFLDASPESKTKLREIAPMPSPFTQPEPRPANIKLTLASSNAPRESLAKNDRLVITKNTKPNGLSWLEDKIAWLGQDRTSLDIDIPTADPSLDSRLEPGAVTNFRLFLNVKVDRRITLIPFINQSVPQRDRLRDFGRYEYQTTVGIGIKIPLWRK